MEIVYCETCGARLSGDQAAKGQGRDGRWTCPQCQVDPEANRATSQLPAASAPGLGSRRGGAPASTGRGRGEAPPPRKPPLAAITMAGGGAIFLIGVILVVTGSRSDRPPETSKEDPDSLRKTAGPESSAKTAAMPAVPPPVSATKVPTPSVPPVDTPVSFTPAAPSESIAREKLAPLKAQFEQARAANDLKNMSRIAGDLGMLTRDYDRTAAAQEAMALIKEVGDRRALESFKDLKKSLDDLKPAKEFTDEMADLVAQVFKFAKDREGSEAGKTAQQALKEFREERAARAWTEAKPWLASSISERVQDALDEAARVAREYPGTPAADEALAAINETGKKELLAHGYSGGLRFLVEVRRAKDAQDLRVVIAELRSYTAAGLPADPRLENLLARAYAALDRCPTPRKPTRVFYTSNAVRTDDRFMPLSGTAREKVKDETREAARFTAKGAEAVRIYCPLSNLVDENAVLTITCKAEGLKRLVAQIYSFTHGETFEYADPEFQTGSWRTAKFVFAHVRKEKKSLRNAVLSFLVLRGEKSDPKDDKAGLLIQDGQLATGRK